MFDDPSYAIVEVLQNATCLGPLYKIRELRYAGLAEVYAVVSSLTSRIPILDDDGFRGLSADETAEVSTRYFEYHL